MSQENKQTKSQIPTQTITKQQLPLSCPTPEMSLWNSHPRVYLPIEKTGQSECPYCGASYQLAAEDND